MFMQIDAGRKKCEVLPFFELHFLDNGLSQRQMIITNRMYRRKWRGQVRVYDFCCLFGGNETMHHRDSVPHEPTANDPPCRLPAMCRTEIQLQTYFSRKKEMAVILFEFDGIYARPCIILRDIILFRFIIWYSVNRLSCCHEMKNFQWTIFHKERDLEISWQRNTKLYFTAQISYVII